MTLQLYIISYKNQWWFGAFNISLSIFFFSFQGLCQNGLQAEYYNGKNFEQYVGKGSMADINLSWETTSPFPGMRPDKCSIRWTGRIEAPSSGDYKFTSQADYGISVWVDDVLVVDDWILHDRGLPEEKIYLEEGQQYDLKVEYFNAMFGGSVSLFWELPREANFLGKRIGPHKPIVIDSKYFFQPSEEQLSPKETLVTDVAEAPTFVLPPPPPRSKSKRTLRKKKTIDNAEQELVTVKEILPQAVTPTAIAQESLTSDIIEMFTPKNVQFERALDQILESSKDDLNTLSLFLKENDYLHLTIEGHTDLAGDPAQNMKLSERRAYAVARYLVKNGVKSSNIEAKGMGDTKPLVRGIGKVYQPENRRVSFLITIPTQTN